MADDELSPAELETLFSATELSPKPSGVTVSPAPQPRRADSVAPPGTAREQIQPHDFKRRRCVRNEQQLCALRALHERFARSFAVGLSAMLRCQVGVQLASVDQMSYGQYVGGLECPTCLSVLRATPLAGELALDLRPAILFPIIDRLLGGGREPSPIARRPLTDIELRLTSRVTGLALAELRGAWRDVADLRISVERVESDARAARIALPAEGVVRIAFEVTVDAARGVLSLCVPASALAPVAADLMSPPAADSRRVASSQTIAEVSKNLRQSSVELVVHLAETRITAGELLNLRAGDIITTHQDVRDPLSVSLEGMLKLRARPGAFKGRKAVQIDEPLESRCGDKPQ